VLGRFHLFDIEIKGRGGKREPGASLLAGEGKEKRDNVDNFPRKTT